MTHESLEGEFVFAMKASFDACVTSKPARFFKSAGFWEPWAAKRSENQDRYDATCD